jgi:protein involved in polysaccharide export with SLBB domain
MIAYRRLAALVPLLLASLLVGACASQAPQTYARSDFQAAPTPARYTAWTEEDYRYRLGAGDEIALRFLVNPDMNVQATIGPDGRAGFPLIGDYKLVGMTLDQASRALSDAYASVLRNPQLDVLVTSYGAAQIYVGGEVKEPGVKAIKGRITVTQAVMAAGGFAETARTGQVAVLRQAPGEDRPHLRVVNVGAALRGGEAGDFALMPGDVVFAPRSAIAEVDLFVKQYMTDLIPFGFSYGFSTNGHF